MTKKNVFFLIEDESELVEQLKEYDSLYYNEGTSPVDDEHYDSLKEHAKSIFPENPYFKDIGAKVSGEKVKLDYILGSLNKVKADTLEAWLDKIDSDYYVGSEKLDGASIEVDYFNGKVVRAMTRGDGFYGQDITDKAKIFCPEINHMGLIHFRAEAMLIGDTHTELGFKTRRNGVVGILNRDGIKNASRITPFFYEILNLDLGKESTEFEILKNDYRNQAKSFEYMEHLFKDTNARVPTWVYFERDGKGIGELVTYLNTRKKNAEYDIDGLVICPNIYIRENIELPKNKVAFKMNEKPVDARVNEVEWRVGRTGRVIPLVHIEPIELQGVTVRKATGFNYKFIVDNQLGKGSLIKLVRSGDVIPYIVDVRTKGMGPLIPHNCPSCEKGLSPIGVDLVCQNPDCGSKIDKRIEHFIIRMGAENITRKTIKKLDIKSIEEMYQLDEFEIATIPGFGVNRGQQIIKEMEKTLTSTPEKFISALGMPLVGRTVSRLVVEYLRPLCDNDDHIMERAFLIHPDELMKIDGIGEAIANSWFKNIRRYGESILSFIQNEGLRWESRVAERIFESMVFTLTGKGPMSRNAIQTIVTSNGGIVKGIGKKTNYLVTGDVDSQSTKAKKARQYGVEIISYEQLMEMLGD